MNIKRIKITGLYGYINKIVEFNPTFTILVGINGSGKTSVLNFVNWLLRPSLEELCTIEFSEIELHFTYNNSEYLILYRQDDVELTIKIRNLTLNIVYHTIQATFDIHPKLITKNPSIKDAIRGHYEKLTPEPSERESWQFLFNELPKAIAIGLDRDVSDPDDRSNVKITSGLSKKNRATPVDNVRQIALRQHSLYNNNVILLNTYLRDKIMISAFDVVDSFDAINSVPNVTIEQVESLEKKVKKYFDENVWMTSNKNKKETLNNDATKITAYFKNLKRILNRSQSKSNTESFDLLYWANTNQFKKIKDLINEFEDFEVKIKQSYQPLKEYLDTLNSFFKDSSKQLYFVPETSELKFNILDKDGNVIQEKRDIQSMSSGELQILILFTVLKFNDAINNSKVIILDEPELSLHPKWQEDFMSAIEVLTPKDTQIIIATHSPLIVGENKKYCKVLLPFNS